MPGAVTNAMRGRTNKKAPVKNITGASLISDCATTSNSLCLYRHFQLYSLFAAYAGHEFAKRSPRFLANPLYLVNRGKISAALVAGLHLKRTSPYFPLAVLCLHDDMLRRADIRARTASDTGFGILDEGGANFFVFASARQANGTHTHNIFTGLNTKSA